MQGQGFMPATLPLPPVSMPCRWSIMCVSNAGWARKELSLRDTRKLLLLVFAGSFCTLLPDMMAVYNILVNGTLEHCSVGSIRTHSLLFSSTAIIFGAIAGYAAYREFSKAAYMAIFAESAFMTHLLLDDI